MPQDVFANTSANWWEGGQKVKPGEKFQPRKLNTPLDKLARKHAGRRSLTKTERKLDQGEFLECFSVPFDEALRIRKESFFELLRQFPELATVCVSPQRR